VELGMHKNPQGFDDQLYYIIPYSDKSLEGVKIAGSVWSGISANDLRIGGGRNSPFFYLERDDNGKEKWLWSSLELNRFRTRPFYVPNTLWRGSNGPKTPVLEPEKTFSKEELQTIFRADVASYGKLAAKSLGYNQFRKSTWRGDVPDLIIQYQLLFPDDNIKLMFKAGVGIESYARLSVPEAVLNKKTGIIEINKCGEIEFRAYALHHALQENKNVLEEWIKQKSSPTIANLAKQLAKSDPWLAEALTAGSPDNWFPQLLEEAHWGTQIVGGEYQQAGMSGIIAAGLAIGKISAILRGGGATTASGIFEAAKTTWTATSASGTRQTYQIYRRTDINWNRIRTSGNERGVGLTNAEAARRHGLPPQLNDGHFATLHHIGQDARGPLVEASTRYHGVGRPGQRTLHGQFGERKPHPTNPVDHEVFAFDKREYWQWRELNR